MDTAGGTLALPGKTFPIAALLRIAGRRGFHPGCGGFAIASLKKEKSPVLLVVSNKTGHETGRGEGI